MPYLTVAEEDSAEAETKAYAMSSYGYLRGQRAVMRKES
jgi:hypothetical protein